jgi:hypothetical protein
MASARTAIHSYALENRFRFRRRRRVIRLMAERLLGLRAAGIVTIG